MKRFSFVVVGKLSDGTKVYIAKLDNGETYWTYEEEDAHRFKYKEAAQAAGSENRDEMTGGDYVVTIEVLSIKIDIEDSQLIFDRTEQQLSKRGEFLQRKIAEYQRELNSLGYNK